MRDENGLWIDLKEFMVSEIDRLTEIDRLREVLFQIYVECGEDTNGAKTLADMGKLTPDIDELALEAVRQLRSEFESESK